MKPESVEKLVWVLIYGGLGLAMLGLWAMGGGIDFALGLAVLGGVLVAAGAVLVGVRSRMDKGPAGSSTPPTTPPTTPPKRAPR